MATKQVHRTAGYEPTPEKSQSATPTTSRDEQFAELAWLTSQPANIGDIITTVADCARASLDIDAAGITLLRLHGASANLGATEPAVKQADDLQHQLGEGPCRDAAHDQHLVEATDIGSDPRWPTWAPRAAALGLHSVLSTNLQTSDNRHLGSLNLYSHQHRQFNHTDQETARLFAAHAAAAIGAAIHVDNLQQALHTRTQIGRATGILMTKYQLSADAAFTVLRRYSQDSNTKLHAIADQVIHIGDLPASTEQHHSRPQ